MRCGLTMQHPEWNCSRVTSYSFHLCAVSHVTKVSHNERQRKKWNHYSWFSCLSVSEHRTRIVWSNAFQWFTVCANNNDTLCSLHYLPQSWYSCLLISCKIKLPPSSSYFPIRDVRTRPPADPDQQSVDWRGRLALPPPRKFADADWRRSLTQARHSASSPAEHSEQCYNADGRALSQ